jgi:hypothetical protein
MQIAPALIVGQDLNEVRGLAGMELTCAKHDKQWHEF